MDGGGKHKQPDSVDDKWKEGLDLVRIRHKAVLARLLYKRNDEKMQNKNKTIEEILESDLKAAEYAEQRCFKEATSELLQLQQQQPLCLYVNDLLRSVESILEPNQQPQQQHHPHHPQQQQQQQGPNETQMELHAVVMAFMKEII